MNRHGDDQRVPELLMLKADHERALAAANEQITKLQEENEKLQNILAQVAVVLELHNITDTAAVVNEMLSPQQEIRG
jgi:hypothetical protein